MTQSINEIREKYLIRYRNRSIVENGGIQNMETILAESKIDDYRTAPREETIAFADSKTSHLELFVVASINKTLETQRLTLLTQSGEKKYFNAGEGTITDHPHSTGPRARRCRQRGRPGMLHRWTAGVQSLYFAQRKRSLISSVIRGVKQSQQADRYKDIILNQAKCLGLTTSGISWEAILELLAVSHLEDLKALLKQDRTESARKMEPATDEPNSPKAA